MAAGDAVSDGLFNVSHSTITLGNGAQGADRIKKGILSVDLPIAAPIIIVDRECGLRKATQELTVLDTLLD
jgi:hypothetical protein